ncbi:Transcriptional regulator, TetR family [Lysobacter dokdonensis DS-58]|uniref:Transcriptional regulator, TetR family n=1 Tax=Lysobacter dokdonensis DS-58 TaxID=1300345 RepID=A0A0A2X455_9GAMM|nr:TetR/AcrR family transcriptional regulator [Lysobacter dokdonensis]KGQ20024.1 Transcriptional regulator, TetR family [Lysobacter dokdonensis DS-58]
MPETRARLLAEAEVLLRTRGYAAFSYADLADRIAIRKASIHHHFPTKEALLAALVDEYLARFVAKLAEIAHAHDDVRDRLRAYAHLFLDGIEHGLLPLCGALAAERAALPDSMRPVVARFFRLHLDWLIEQLDAGIAAGTIDARVDANDTAHLLLGALEGGSFVAWALDEPATMLRAFDAAMQSLTPQRTAPASRRPSPRRSS